MFIRTVLLATGVLALPQAQAATFSGRVEGKDTVVIEAKGGDKDEQCNAAMSFKYRDLKSDSDKPKEDGRQFCPPKVIGSGTMMEMCRLQYTGVTDVEVVPPATGDCELAGTPDPNPKKPSAKNK